VKGPEVTGQESVTSSARRLRHVLSKPGMIRIPGVHDGFSARAAEVLGFHAVYVGGGVGVGINLGLPDIGVMDSHHLISTAGRIARAVEIPLICDLDDGGGSPLRVRQAVADAERAGIAGMHIEDTDFARGRHLPDNSADMVVDFEAAVRRIRAAIDGRRDSDTVIIGRTDAAPSSLEEAVRRGQAFAAAGADLVFVAHLTADRIKTVASALPVPLMNCVVGPDGASDEQCAAMEAHGLKILFDHRAVPLAAYAAEWAALERFKDVGDVPADSHATRAKVAEVIRKAEWAEIARGYASH
jgi:2-methylisocitrate lyase-like PEP mutase family enzyme